MIFSEGISSIRFLSPYGFEVLIHDVLHVPSLTTNLFSPNKFARDHAGSHFEVLEFRRVDGSTRHTTSIEFTSTSREQSRLPELEGGLQYYEGLLKLQLMARMRLRPSRWCCSCLEAIRLGPIFNRSPIASLVHACSITSYFYSNSLSAATFLNDSCLDKLRASFDDVPTEGSAHVPK